jgi:hypothetical protein
MTTVAPRLPARFKPVYASLVAVVLMGSSAHSAAAQRDAGSIWRAGVAGTVLIRAYDNGGEQASVNQGLARAGLQGIAYVDRWLTPEVGLRVEAGWVNVGNGHVYRESPPLPPGTTAPPSSCSLVCSHLEAAGGEMSLLTDEGGTRGAHGQVEIGAGVYRSVARPYDPGQPKPPMLTVGTAHIGWSRGFDSTPLRVHLRAQTFAGDVMQFAAGAGLGLAF